MILESNTKLGKY